jgi:hypothetical protein
MKLDKPIPDYLTESSLGKILCQLFPEYEIIHDKSVPHSENKRMRPDYRIEALKLIFEFDGPSHYTQSKRILMDETKDLNYTSLGYKIIRIPYFIQFDQKLLDSYGMTNRHNITCDYPHGFVDNGAILPSDFCELGVKKFERDLSIFFSCRSTIIQSIKKKIEDCGDIRLVIPESLYYLLEEQ